jgi:hypothetical protein
MCPRSLIFLAMFVALAFPARPASAKIFDVPPGTNTLIAARDAVRIWRAAGHVGEAAEIRLARGEYRLTEPLLLAAQDGNATWTARDPQNTFIGSGEHPAPLTAGTDGVWRTQTELRFEQLFLNGRRLTRARSPITGFFKLENVRQEMLPDGKARLSAQIPAAAFAALPTDAAALRAVQLFVFHRWDTSRYPIDAVDAAAKTVSVIGKPMQPSNPWDKDSRFIFDNCQPATSLAPGTWFLAADGELSYRPLTPEKIGKADFVAPQLERLLEIHDATNLNFAGLRFGCTKYRMPPEGCPPAQAASLIGAAIEITGARGIVFENCEITRTGNYGIWFRQGCRACRLQHSLLEDLGAGGVRIGEMTISKNPDEQTGEIVVDNNIIHGCGRVHPSAVGVWIGQSANNRVTHNDISDTFYTAVSVGWTWGYGRSLATNNFIGFNRIHRIGQGALSDMGGIYTLGVSPGSAAVGNVIYDVRAHDYGGWGIYPDEGSTGWRIASNLVWRCTCVKPASGGAFHQHYGATNDIVNNIFAFSSGPPLQATRVENHLSLTLERNLIVSSNAAFFGGPWDKIQFASRSNGFAIYHAPKNLFPGGDFAAWQKTGHDAGSIVTNLEFLGVWPDVTLPQNSPAFSTGFKRFDPKSAGVYGDRAWQRRAAEMENQAAKTPAIFGDDSI